ncbi:flagellar motor switch protein FliG [Desulfuromonas thiophila]|uniref:Flagellar motor switch protein FliG n=1 Tax=Desulfuromonas thiophila TaxID=57664 RepID=A0A1G7BMQ1_9BACT|nr:flagellar motor switch protein FliG [Desulfuromonas thiophila]SDE27485.1 flagellar motor switch protein FliG [Desulfuromonas thiophila]
MSNLQYNRMSGLEKAAILLLCLGETATAAVFRELSPTDVRTLTRVMMGIEHIPAELASEVMMEFQNAQKKNPGMFIKSHEFIRRALAETGDERSEQIYQEVISGVETRPLETIATMQPRMVASLLEGEHPQTLALILSTQKSDHTSKVLKYLPDGLAADVMYRIARIEKVAPEVLAQIEEALMREIGGIVSKEQQEVGGVDKVVDILGRMEKGSDRAILDSIESQDPDLAESIRKKMFTFSDLVNIDNRAMQMILREINNDTLTMALKTAPEDLKNKIFSNISNRAAEMIQEDLEAMGPVRLSDVEAMQQTIVKLALKLEEEGQIVIPGRGAGDVLV